jgi:hypothetical protein
MMSEGAGSVDIDTLLERSEEFERAMAEDRDRASLRLTPSQNFYRVV